MSEGERGKEGVANVVSNKWRKCVKRYKCVNLRTVWVEVKVGIEK